MKGEDVGPYRGVWCWLLVITISQHHSTCLRALDQRGLAGLAGVLDTGLVRQGQTEHGLVAGQAGQAGQAGDGGVPHTGAPRHVGLAAHHGLREDGRQDLDTVQGQGEARGGRARGTWRGGHVGGVRLAGETGRGGGGGRDCELLRLVRDCWPFWRGLKQKTCLSGG